MIRNINMAIVFFIKWYVLCAQNNALSFVHGAHMKCTYEIIYYIAILGLVQRGTG